MAPRRSTSDAPKKPRVQKTVEQRIAETKASLAKLEAEQLATRADPKLAKALKQFEHVATFLPDDMAKAVRAELAKHLAPAAPATEPEP